MTDADEVSVFSFKIIVVGDPMVGKTSLLTKFASGKFKEVYIPTIGANITSKVVSISGGDTVKMQVWDIAGQKQFYNVYQAYFHGAVGVVIVFDVTRRESFENILRWRDECFKMGVQIVPMVLVGNKVDLEDKRTINDKKGMLIANMIGAPYFETSAQTGQNVDEMFAAIATNVHTFFEHLPEGTRFFENLK